MKGTMKEYDPQSMIDDIKNDAINYAKNTQFGRKNDLKFTTAGDYMKDVESKPTGGETWQTKATAKGAVPKYYTPKELQQMSEDKGYEYRYVSQQIYPQDMAKYIRENNAFTDDEILELLEAIDSKYIERFGMNPYERLMASKMTNGDNNTA